MKSLQTFLALLISCTTLAAERPIATSVAVAPLQVQAGRMVTISIPATNQTEQRQLWPHNLKVNGSWMIDGAGIGFDRHADNAPTLSRWSVDSSPPVFLWIEPGEKKVLRFSWTASTDNIGPGFLFVRLPPAFEAPKPIPITVVPKDTEQGGAGEPATRAESDFEGGDKPNLEAEERSR